MRLWTVHPRYLDARGLVALWREALLARTVLQGKTKGYRHHPQLERFLRHPAPQPAISCYLHAIYSEALARGYSFDEKKIIGGMPAVTLIPVSDGQLLYEWQHLLRKLAQRSPNVYTLWCSVRTPCPHPLFDLQPGAVEPWERIIPGEM